MIAIFLLVTALLVQQPAAPVEMNDLEKQFQALL